MRTPTIDDLSREARYGTAGLVIVGFLIGGAAEAGLSGDAIAIGLAFAGTLALSFVAADGVEAAVGRVRQ